MFPSPTTFYPNPIFRLMLAHPSAVALAQEVMSLAPASRVLLCQQDVSFPDKTTGEYGIYGMSPRQGDVSQGPNDSETPVPR